MSETHLGRLDQKENSDAQYLSVRKLELDVTHADIKALNKAGKDDVETNRSVDNLPNVEIRDYSKDFSLGVPPGEKLSLEQISQTNPELGRHINALAGNAMVGSFQTAEYTRNALTEMVSKYGPDRVENMLKTLEGLQPNHKLRPETLSVNSFDSEGLNHSLYNLSDLIQENKGGDLQRLSEQLKSEGYQKRLPLADLTPRFIDTLSSSPQERQALIEYSQADARAFVGANPEYKHGHLPSETLSAYKEFEKAHPGGL